MSRNTSFVVATTRGRPIYIQPGRTAGTRKTIDKKHRALRTRAWQRAVFEPIQMIAQVMRCSIRAVEYKLPAALKQLAAILARADLL